MGLSEQRRSVAMRSKANSSNQNWRSLGDTTRVSSHDRPGMGAALLLQKGLRFFPSAPNEVLPFISTQNWRCSPRGNGGFFRDGGK